MKVEKRFKRLSTLGFSYLTSCNIFLNKAFAKRNSVELYEKLLSKHNV